MSKALIGSRVGLGTASLHHLPRLNQRLALLEAAFDAGIRYFDTAPLYGHESAERVLGRFVSSHRSDHRITVASKIGLMPNPVVSAVPPLLMPYIALRSLTTRLKVVSPSAWQPKREYSASYLLRRVERSLRLMGLDRLDIVYLHEPEMHELRGLDELGAAADSLKQRGLVGAFGVSARHDVAKWLQAHSRPLSETLQVEVPAKMDDALNQWFAENVAVTFGHFRMIGEELSGVEKKEKLALVARRAVSLNRSGTILFSSTRQSHVSEFVSAIENADRQRQESDHAV